MSEQRKSIEQLIQTIKDNVDDPSLAFAGWAQHLLCHALSAVGTELEGALDAGPLHQDDVPTARAKVNAFLDSIEGLDKVFALAEKKS